MAHPLFARLDRQLELVRRELGNVEQADARFGRLKKLARQRRIAADLYHEWSHNASLADGIAAIYTGLDSILESMAAEIDRYKPRGDAFHADLVDGMAVEVEGVRPAVLAAATRRLMHDARKFRHVARHKYALELRRSDIAAHYRLVRRLVPAFERDYRRFVKRMLAVPRGGEHDREALLIETCRACFRSIPDCACRGQSDSAAMSCGQK